MSASCLVTMSSKHSDGLNLVICNTLFTKQEAFDKVPREVISCAMRKLLVRMASIGSDVYVHRCENN